MKETSVGLSKKTHDRLYDYWAWFNLKESPRKTDYEDAVNHLLDVADRLEGWSKGRSGRP
ncbi:MAG: hypothetical protein JRM73_04765 [Nitrososphaerota archaeon]|nr:hypothetical protein [Nitrososphaerota archaeon]